jgi:hypothetical protein
LLTVAVGATSVEPRAAIMAKALDQRVLIMESCAPA